MSSISIPDEQKRQLVQAIVTLITVLVSIAVTLATQAIAGWIDGPADDPTAVVYTVQPDDLRITSGPYMICYPAGE